MVKTLEEYFREQDLSPGQAAKPVSLSEAERVFLDKHLGLKEEDIFDRLGMDAPARITPVVIPESEPGRGETSARAARAEEVSSETPQGVETARRMSFRERVARETGLRKRQRDTVARPDDTPVAEEVSPEVSGQERVLRDTSPGTVSVEEEETGAAVREGAETDVQAETERREQPVRAHLEPELKGMDKVQLISFFVRGREFTIPVPAVQEVIRAVPATQMPEAPEYYRGIVNIRGRVTPLISLASLLDIDTSEEEDSDKRNRFIIVCRRHGLQVGLAVDNVATMYRVDGKDIEWNIESRMGGNIHFVSALMRKNNDELIGIISIDRIVDMMVSNNGEA